MTAQLRYDHARLTESLLRHECYRQFVYSDKDGRPVRDPRGGTLTIGIGRNLEDRGITLKEAMYLLGNDLIDTINDLDRELPWWRTLDSVRQEVVMEMAFNMGIGSRNPAKGLLSFRNTLRYIQASDYDRAAEGMLLSLWARQVGGRADGLAEMMRTGQAAT